MASIGIITNVPLPSNRLPLVSCSSSVQASFPRHINAGTPLSSPGSACNQVLRIGDIGINKAKLYTRNMGIARSSQAQVPPVEAIAKSEPLKVMISGAPASGKGTQCEFIAKKYGLVHIAAGDLLRVEVAAGTENGKRAKEYMEKGLLVPDEIVVTMVKERLAQQDAQEKGWLLDGYPRSLSQAAALESLGIRPDLFIVLDVPDGILVERVVGRRLDPVTGKIYHLKYSPPETDEIAGRLTQRFDDTEEKVKLRLQTHHKNVEDVLSIYEDVLKKVDGTRSKEQVFEEIDAALGKVLQRKREKVRATAVASGN
eukprot:Gb_32688 [translate_table: standard]